MNTAQTIALYTHICSGFIALLSGFLVIVLKKGNRLHKRLGFIFFLAMLGVSASALFISYIKSNSFLFFIGIFSFYMNYNGFRSVRNKELTPTYFDWLIAILGAGNSLCMLISMNPILIAFGILSGSLVFSDTKMFIAKIQNREIPKLQYLYRHISRMLGTYIATTTAFLVVNGNGFEPGWLLWLLPSIIGTPLIFFWIRQYTKK